jgi:hypothetical protein
MLPLLLLRAAPCCPSSRRRASLRSPGSSEARRSRPCLSPRPLPVIRCGAAAERTRGVESGVRFAALSGVPLPPRGPLFVATGVVRASIAAAPQIVPQGFKIKAAWCARLVISYQVLFYI